MAQFNHHDPLFPTHHSQKGPNITSSGLFFCPRSQLFISSDVESYQFNGSNSRFKMRKVLGCTNGLLYGTLSRNTEVFIFNPITKDTVYIPNSKNHRSLGLVTDPHNPDFGFTMVSLVFSRGDYCPLKFQVYSSKTGEWRASKNDSMIVAYYAYLFLRKHQVVFTGGNKVCWSLVRNILWFDIEKEVAGVIQCPDLTNLAMTTLLQHQSSTAIGVCDGELSYSRITKKREIEVWLLRDKSNEYEWVRKYNVSLQRIFEKNWNVISKIFKKMVPSNQRKLQNVLVISRTAILVLCLIRVGRIYGLQSTLIDI
ncbi:hypothetical protein Sjap_017318 [Stephania japonica]|uniref:F-box protein At3g26010-like beta-propeller domain-containing protein n=1 Tax=Stephania japonica TaxID=461633 RepID=A0AAP0I5Z1_9MAGN